MYFVISSSEIVLISLIIFNIILVIALAPSILKVVNLLYFQLVASSLIVKFLLDVTLTSSW